MCDGGLGRCAGHAFEPQRGPLFSARLRRGLREAFRFHFRRSEHDRIVGGEIIRALSKPVVVGCDPKHHRPNCWIVSFFGQRPHFFGSHAPVRWGFEEIIRMEDALASQNGLPKFTKKGLYHALFGTATRQTLTRRANPREAFTAPRDTTKRGRLQAAPSSPTPLRTDVRR